VTSLPTEKEDSANEKVVGLGILPSFSHAVPAREGCSSVFVENWKSLERLQLVQLIIMDVYDMQHCEWMYWNAYIRLGVL
jgi:hypothetical protein